MKRALVASKIHPRIAPESYAVDHDLIVLPFWCSPEFADKVRGRIGRECWQLRDLMNDYPYSVRLAYDRGHQCAEEGPSQCGIPLLRGWENALSNFFLSADALARLAEELSERAVEEVRLTSDDETARLLQTSSQQLGNPFGVVGPRPSACNVNKSRFARVARWLELANESRRDGDWRQLFWVPLEALDQQYAWRSRIQRRKSSQPGEILYYSSYLNYSRTLAKHRRARGENITWVTNNYSARIGVPSGEHRLDIWQFGKGAGKGQSTLWAGSVSASPGQYLGRTGRIRVKDAMEVSPVIDELNTRVIPLVAAEIALLNAGLDEVQPREIWVANQWGSEAGVIGLARRKGIPVTQVQHGTLEQYYACAPIYSDRFLVWGEMWKQAVNAPEQSKVEVVNPGFEMVPADRRRRTGNPRVTFFTAPVGITGVPFWNPQVARWEVVQLLTRLSDAGHRIKIRVHPADRIENWRKAWSEYGGGTSAEVRFDKTSALEDVLVETDVAVMFFSTVFLNCCASGIPVVSMAWYPNMWRGLLEREHLVHFADSLGQAFEMVRDLGTHPSLAPDFSRVLTPVRETAA